MISRRSFLQASLAAPAVHAQSRGPNILLIMTDDQGWFDLGVHGNPHVETPNIDRLAAEGVRFTHFHASPVCAPTRAALMTGRHYQRTGCVDTYLGRDTLDANEVTLGQVLQRHGYRTGCIGKWHLGRYMRYHPNQRGFDEYFGFWQYGFMNRYDDSSELFEGRERVKVKGYITDVLTNRAISFIEQHRRAPFFLYLPYNAVHNPFDVPDPFIERYLKKGLPLREARIYGMVSSLDDNIGRLLGAVDRAGLRENTAVFFMTDNGGVSHYYKCGLRGNKGSVWEGGVRVPFIGRCPGRFPAGAVVDAMAQHIDVLPTVCELTGAPLPDRPLDGASIARLLRDGRGETPHRFLFHQWNRGHPVLATVPGDRELKASWAVRDARGLKYHWNGELYDLNSDPGESRNIAAAQPAAAKALRGEFERWFSQVTAREYGRVPIEIGRPDENPVEIDLLWADAHGKRIDVRYGSYNRDTIENWSDAGEYVSWKVDVVEPGAYEVTLEYGCDPGGQGSRLRVQCGPAAFEHTVQPTAGRTIFRPLLAGAFRLDRGPARFEIRPVTIKGKELLVLHKIWVRRVDAPRH
ncbi:MAG: arylsulfatase [Acidobacteria bacterium]|nr:arylsulfatase [Acidobacteriota bacterium]